MGFRSIQLLVFLLFLSQAVAQSKQNKNTSFVLMGDLKGRDTGIIVLWYPKIDGQYVRDTAFINKGKFQFTGNISEPSFSWLLGSRKDGNTISLFLGAGNQYISVEENKFEDFTMFGSFTQKQYDTLRSQRKTLDNQYRDWKEEHRRLAKQLKTINDSLQEEKILNRINEIADTLNNENRKLTVAFISSHPDSYVSSSDLDGILANRQLQTDSVESLYNNFSARIKNSRKGKLIKEELYKRKYHFKAPDFTSFDMGDRKISLSEFKDRYVLLNFWASWCVPCIKEIPELKNFLNTYSDKGFEIINISTDSNKESWIKAVKKYEIQNFQNILANSEIREKYSSMTQPIPSQLLINRDGIVVWNSLSQSFKSLEGFLEKEFTKK